MRIVECILIFSQWLAMSSALVGNAVEFEPRHLRCEYQINPKGIDQLQPRLSWTLEKVNSQTMTRGLAQTAYQVLVASSEQALRDDQGDLWDSGKTSSDSLFNIVYSGKPLSSWRRCFWKVRVWDQDDRPSNWSSSASWTMGLLKAADWNGAKWIGIDVPKAPISAKVTTPKQKAERKKKDDSPENIPKPNESPAERRLAARQLRREFDLSDQVRSAKVAFCGLGLSELYINGKRVSEDVLSPPLTQYDKRDSYVVYDVAKLLKPGRNAVGVWLGNGRFWAPRLKYPKKTRHFGAPRLRLIMRIEYAGGAVQEIVSDETWKATDQGPIRANNEYDGEDYDARMELPGWATVGYKDAAWKTADILSSPGGVLSGRRSPPMRVIETRKPIARTSPKPGVYVFDMGQNLVGWCRLRVKGAAGTTVRLRHAETLQSDGTLYTANLRSALCEDHYTLKGGGDVEVYQPRFTYHGFRYVEVTGYPGDPGMDDIEACVVHDDLESAGDFDCSNDLLNHIYANCRWGIRGNYRSIPTDCPQRDERHGWLGDRAIGCRGETHLFNVAALYEKWLTDMADAQRPNGSVPDLCPAYWVDFYRENVTWEGAVALIPDCLLEQYDDQRIIEQLYPTMRAWVEHMLRYVVHDRISRDSYGDWCVPPEDPKLIFSEDPKRKTNGELLATAYFQHILKLMSQYAALVNKPDDAARYASIAERMKAALNKKFFKASKAQYDNGTQTSSIVPLALDLVPQEHRKCLFSSLVKTIEGESKSHIGTGLIGIQFLLRVLSDNGRPDLAFRIAAQKDYPGWGYMVSKGATTIWELWNGDTADPAMNSGNHVMQIGDLLTWLDEYLAGIRLDPASPGYRHIIMKPVPVAGLDYVRAWQETISGRIESRWWRENGQLFWDVSIPIGTGATIYVPAADPADIMEGDAPTVDALGLKFLRQENGAVVYEAQSGEYHFRVKNN
ncbi:MAG: family 78 glycoside hydrolase catalytic domain [Thermoguttaceae bacterium]